MTIEFGIAPINWTNDDDPNLGGKIPLEQCLKEMQLAGFSGCELGNKFPRNKTELLKAVSPYNLQVTTDWIGTQFTVAGLFEKSLDDFKKQVLFLKEVGVKALKVCECGHSIQGSEKPIFSTKVEFSEKQWQELFRGLELACEFASNQGMFVAYHHHLGTGVENRDQIDYLLQKGPKEVSLLPDTGHLLAAEIEPIEVFRTYRERIRYIHLKDIRRRQWERAKEEKMSFMDAVRAGIFTVPGDGEIDFGSIFDFLKETDYHGWMIVEAEQDPEKAPPLEYAQKSMSYIKRFF